MLLETLELSGQLLLTLDRSGSSWGLHPDKMAKPRARGTQRQHFVFMITLHLKFKTIKF